VIPNAKTPEKAPEREAAEKTIAILRIVSTIKYK
jgi:hypothetical protein